MADPLLSVVTPSYNQSEFLERNLRSVDEQDLSNVEHVVVDGGSTDGTVEILEAYEDQYDLRWVSREDRGQTHAINQGIEMANGEWISWQNSDDYYLPGALDYFEQAVTRHPSSEVVYGDLHIVDENEELIDTKAFTRPSRLIQRYLTNVMATQSSFVRSSVFEAVGKLDEQYEYAMDVDLFWRLMNYDPEFLHVPEPLGAVRVYEGTKSFDTRAEQIAESQQVTNGRDRQYPVEPHLPDRALLYAAWLVRKSQLLAEGQFRQVLDELR